MKSAIVYVSLLFLGFPAFSQVTIKKGKKEKVDLAKEWKKVREQGKLHTLSRADRRDIKKVRAWLKKRNEAFERVKKAAKEFLEKYKDELSSGEGLYYKGMAYQTIGKKKEAYAAFKKFRQETNNRKLKLEAGVTSVYLLYSMNKYDEAKALLEEVVKEDLDGTYSKALSSIESRLKGRSYTMWKKRESLKGKPLPDIPILKVIGAKDFKWENLKGKVILIDFWATWCGPCRVVIPGLVRLQKEFKDQGLQVVGVTSLYGFGWKLEKREGDLLIGRSAGRGLKKEKEIELNRIFHDKVPLNYPIIITKRRIASEKFGITGIPTIFLVDRKGKVRWYKVGSGGEEELREMVEKLLKEKA